MRTVNKFLLIFVVTFVIIEEKTTLSEFIDDEKNDFSQLIKELQSGDVGIQNNALLKIRKFLSRKTEFEKENLFKLVFGIVKCLKSSNTRIQYEATVTLSELVTTIPESTDAIIEADDAIPKLIELIRNKLTYESAISILATMITQKPDDLREIYLKSEIIVPILLSFSPMDILTFNDHIKIIIANLFEEKNRPPKNDISLLIPLWANLIYEYDAATVLKTIETVGHLSKESENLEKYVVDKNVMKSMLQLINHHETYIRGFLTIGLFYVTKGSAEQVQYLFDNGLLEGVEVLLSDPNETVHIMATILLSNVLNKTDDQYQAVFDKGFAPTILEYFKSEIPEKRQVAVKFFVQALKHGKEEHILALLKMNVICHLSMFLKDHENESDEDWIHNIKNLLKCFKIVFEKIPKSEAKAVSLEITKCGGGNDVITKFVKNKNSELSEAAVKLIYEMGRSMDILDSNDSLREDL